MGKPFKGPEFKALFEEWNRRLIEDGHKEIEDFSGAEPQLKVWESNRWRNSNKSRGFDPIRMEFRQQYYEMAEVVLRQFPFQTPEHKRIWELHCRGISPRKIATELKTRKCSKSNVYLVIAHIERRSGLRRG